MVLDIELEPTEAATLQDGCVFCAIIRGVAPAEIVLDDPAGIAFLDRSPLCPGHVLVAPRTHAATLPDLPVADVGPFFQVVQRLAWAVPKALQADGSFVAINSVVSQSVPHLHVHVVPRRRNDRLFSRNLTWIRHPYRDAEQMRQTANAIRATLEKDARPDG